MYDELKQFKETFNKMILSVAKQAISDTSYNKILSDTIKSLKKALTPTIDEKTQKSLIKSYEEWGKIGWTIPKRAAGTKIFNTPPNAFKNPNNKMARYCTEPNMQKLFNELRKYCINHLDLETSIELYNTRHYKACAMMLFSIIDAKLIRMQKKGDMYKRKNKYYRHTGNTAGKIILNRKEINKSEDDIIFHKLSYLNTVAAFQKFFENGNDFKVQPNVANRNFLAHGMYTKRVYKKDCNQIFLLMSNLFYHINVSFTQN